MIESEQIERLYTAEEILKEANNTTFLESSKKGLPTRKRIFVNPRIKKPTRSYEEWIIPIIAVIFAVGFFIYILAPKGITIDSIKGEYIDSITMEFSINDLHGYQPKDLILSIDYNKSASSMLLSGEEIKPGKYLLPISSATLQIGENEVQISLWVEGKDKPIEVSNVARFITK